MRTYGRMRLGAGLRWAAAVLVLMFHAVDAHGAGKCEGDSARFRIMPPVIGRPEATVRYPYDLPCDSMVVPRGQTTIIHGLSVVNFGPGSRPGGKIVVKGKLVIEGKPGHPAYLAGSIASNVIGFAPGGRPWFGIQADSGASLRLSHARFYNASAGVVLSSRDVILKNCFFKGTSALTLPDTSLALNPVGQSLSSLDLREGWLSIFSGGSAAPTAAEPADVSEERPAAPTPPAAEALPVARPEPAGRKRQSESVSHTGSTWKWLAAGAGILAASAAVWWALPMGEEPPSPPAPPVSLDAAPALPEPGMAGN